MIWYESQFYTKDKYNSGKLLIKQVKVFEENRLIIAKKIVSGIGENIYEVLYHYYKHNKKEVKGTLDWIKKEFYKRIESSSDIKSLMSVEGEVWQRFYGEFKVILPEDFIMNKRCKRPPDNPINALISFGNTLLYTKTISDLVNRKILKVDKHFDKKVNYCLLNEEGRNIFIKSFEERLESVFMHPKLKRRVSYKTAIKLDCYKLIKFIMEEKDFKPFSLKEGY